MNSGVRRAWLLPFFLVPLIALKYYSEAVAAETECSQEAERFHADLSTLFILGASSAMARVRMTIGS